MVNLDRIIIHIIVNVIFISPFLWLSGRSLVGGKKAKFSDAVMIVVFGTLIGTVFGVFFTGFTASIIQLILWLLLIKHFFDCGWLMALAVSIIAVIIFAVIVAILGLIGFALIRFI
ncbi:hypothetical protein KEJ21_02405 [Candidatus Bathyarchaeota archaeon]|nr:hypothetical protein [Candidatus Bathyarchaeota archaeon]MBS7630688.1 hypothetical protein [Candidatus Bathyarchaeota archaeon]